MVMTPRPLEEKMTLFWHNHFATAIYKVTFDNSCVGLVERTLTLSLRSVCITLAGDYVTLGRITSILEAVGLGMTCANPSP